MPKEKKQTKEERLQAFGVLDYRDGFPTPDECFPANGVTADARNLTTYSPGGLTEKTLTVAMASKLVTSSSHPDSPFPFIDLETKKPIAYGKARNPRSRAQVMMDAKNHKAKVELPEDMEALKHKHLYLFDADMKPVTDLKSNQSTASNHPLIMLMISGFGRCVPCHCLCDAWLFRLHVALCTQVFVVEMRGHGRYLANALARKVIGEACIRRSKSKLHFCIYGYKPLYEGQEADKKTDDVPETATAKTLYPVCVVKMKYTGLAQEVQWGDSEPQRTYHVNPMPSHYLCTPYSRLTPFSLPSYSLLTPPSPKGAHDGQRQEAREGAHVHHPEWHAPA